MVKIMNNAYFRRFNLEVNPFVKSEKNTTVNTSDVKEAEYRLDYLLQVKGFGVITGEPGLGKTTCVRAWATSLNEAAYKVIYIPMGSLSVSDFYRYLASELGNISNFTKLVNFKNIQNSIRRLDVEKRITPIIIIDEADQLTDLMLKDLKVLFNFDMDSKNRAIAILVGQRDILTRLQLHMHEPLRQRVNMTFEFSQLEPGEAKNYISTKLDKAGCKINIFDDGAINSIIEYANYVPRIIDSVIDKSMLIADQLNETMITKETVRKATSILI